MQATVRVKGLRELERSFRRMEGDLRRDLQREISGAADIVAQEARGIAGGLGLSSRTVGGYRPRVRGSSGFVEQRRRKTTGKRPDFGVLQMRRVLLPALGRKQAKVVEAIDQMLGRMAGEEGF